jgi:hypothetical protein
VTKLATKFRKRIREALAEEAPRQTGRCYWCGEALAEDFHWDHLLPQCLGGQDLACNLVQSCPSCNMTKNGKPLGQMILESSLPDELLLDAIARYLGHDMLARRKQRRRLKYANPDQRH